MTLTELRYIVAVAQTKNFGKAAQKCFVSQPTLSVAVKKLEEQLGVAIFERDKNSVRITEVGEGIVTQAQKVLEEADRIKVIANAGQDQLSQPLRVGAIYTVGPYLFPDLIPALKQAAPDLPLIIEENYTARLSEKLHNGELDAIIIALPFKEAGIKTEALYDEKFDVVMPTDHKWKTKKAIQPEDFAGETVLLLGEGNCFRDEVIAACPACAVPKQAQTQAEKMLEGSSLETIRYMVVNGLGVSVFPRSAISEHCRSHKLITVKPFAKPEPYRQIALAYRDSFPRPEAIELLSTVIKTANQR
tara:strand:- start:1369 stop:2277 length:909 start_codon:yes stop_codon:yes gene_type:complete